LKRAAGSHMPNAISLLVLDVDGVLTDGRLYFGARGEALKVFHVHDGHGIAQLRRVGVQVAVIGLDVASFEQEAPDEDTLALLEGAGVPVMRVKYGESLAQILESGPESRYARRG